ncbi:MAG: TnpV protein [Firmicutes bacterium]|nr:TnpV protein [Bacillota bacterium]MBQ3261627.1 TnpV protein [Oscillospiraceae bacterium]
MSTKLTYHWEGDYLIPDLVAPESTQIGIWGERRRQFLRNHQRTVYDALMMNGKLNAHLEDVDRNAEEMMDRLMSQMAEREGVTEQLKAEDQMTWIQRMNNIRHRAEEIVRKDLIEN